MIIKQPKELRLKGVIASPGIAIGQAFKHEIDAAQIVKRNITSTAVETEIKKLADAIGNAKKELGKIRAEADKRIGKKLSKIFEAQLLILEDAEFFKQVSADIRRLRLNAEYVYKQHVNRTLKSLKSSEDNYLKEMTEDIASTADRVMCYLVGTPSETLVSNKTKVALARSFSPGEIVLMNKYRIPGFAASAGGPTSHMVLVARSLSIPAVVGVNKLTRRCPEGSMVIIDGDKGVIVVNPTEQTLKTYKSLRRKRQGQMSRQLRKIGRLPETTSDGHHVKVMANIDFPSNTDSLLTGARIAVGLYRTEFFYLSNNEFPSEEEQTRIYSNIVRTFFPSPVTMRVYDLGSDKVKGRYREHVEMNPALGWRGIRFDLDSLDVFRTQVRALLQASELGNMKIMLPMISSAMEIVKAKRVIRSVMKELRDQGIKFDENIEIGIMVEVPSAALMSDELARHVDFFSIGTNDLVQYTLAVDRGNKKLAKFYRELHPAVLRLIKQTIDAGAKMKIPVSMCGELAGNLNAVPLLIGMGLTEFSVNPLSVHPVRKTIAAVSLQECKKLSERVMALPTTEKIEAVLRDWYQDRFGDV